MYKTLLAAVLVPLLAACHANNRPARSPSRTSGPFPLWDTTETTIIRRTFGVPSADYVRLGIGRLDVVVRRAEQPTINLRTRVAVRADSGRSIPKDSDSLGVVRFESLPAGSYRLYVWGARGEPRVTVEPGCRTDVEFYQGTSFIGIAPPPDMKPRLIITTCPKSSD